MNRHRFLAIAQLELGTHLHSPLLWGLIGFTAFATLFINPAAMIPSGDAAIGGVRPFSNSRYALAQTFALTGLLFYPFLTSILAGLSALSTDEAKMGELTHSTPLTVTEYILGKLAGIFGALGLVLLLHVTLAALWYEGGSVLGSDAIQGPFRILNYVAPALIFLAPGVWFCAVLAFAAGERTRSALAVYALPTVLLFVTLGGLFPRPPSALDGVLDPLFSVFDLWGARWLSATIFHADRGVAFYNHAPLAFDAPFLLNRLFVVVVPILATLGALRNSRRTIRGVEGARPQTWKPPVAGPTDAPRRHHQSPRWPDLKMTSTPPGLVRGALEIARVDHQQVRTQPAAWLFIIFAMLLTLESAGSARGPFDSEVILTSGRLAVNLIEVVTAMGCLLLLFHLVESLDRTRRLGLSGLVGATPVRSASILLGPQLTGAVLVGLTLMACGLVCLSMLVIGQVAPIEVWPFALVWGLLLPPTFLLWAAFVTAVFSVVRERQTTYVVGLLALMGTVVLLLSGSMTWVTNWPLWGALRWSDMGIFEMDREALALNRLTVLGLSVLFGALAFRNWRRTEVDVMVRHRSSSSRPFVRTAVRLAPFLLLPLIPGLVLSHRIDEGVDGKRARARDKLYWRLNAANWGAVRPPQITHADVSVDLNPAGQGMSVRGVFTMVNASNLPIGRLPFTVGQSFRDLAWTIDGHAAAVEDRSGLHILTPPVPLTPGGETRVGFAYTAEVPLGITRNGGEVSEFILPGGVNLSTLGREFLPIPGVVEGIGVDGDNRAEPFEPSNDAWRQDLPPIIGNAVPFTSRMEVTAPSEYTVNAVGHKTQERTSAGRTTAVWESGHPVRFLNLVAGRLAVKRRNGAAVFFHPAHAFNIGEMLDTLAAARRLYSDWFYPYPWKELRLSEYPDHATRAQGFPTNIPFSEGMGFLTRSDGAIGLPTIVTAHEAAHQWWGHLLTPGRARGADVLIEGMAHYSTMLLLESEHGPQARIDFAIGLESRYAAQRRVDAEQPLTRIVGEGSTDETATSDKGAWVMWMLHQHLGRDVMLAGLRSFIRRFEGSRDHPAIQDLIEELRPLARSEAEYQAFVDQWFFEVTLPEFQIRAASSRPTPAGWTVTATVENVGTGASVVEVAASRGVRFAHGNDASGPGYQDARTSVRLPPGQPLTLSWTAPFAPDAVVIDPDALVLQLNRSRAHCEGRCLGVRDAS